MAAAPALTAVHQMASVLPTAHFGGELVVLISQGLYANEPKAALAMQYGLPVFTFDEHFALIEYIDTIRGLRGRS